MEHENLEQELLKKLNEMDSKGVLFDSINYNSNEQLDSFLNNLTKEQAIYCLVEACKSAYNRGSYKLDESEALSRALRVIGEI
jgi:spore coat polysaccharide biosynthesis predicted glycosyltransferase SpsG